MAEAVRARVSKDSPLWARILIVVCDRGARFLCPDMTPPGRFSILGKKRRIRQLVLRLSLEEFDGLRAQYDVPPAQSCGSPLTMSQSQGMAVEIRPRSRLRERSGMARKGVG